MSDLDLSQLDEWIEATLLPLPGVQAASRNPAGLDLPGILVQITNLGVDVLDQSEWRVDLRVLLITPDLDVASATESLVAMLNVVRPALNDPPGDFTPTTFQNDQGNLFPAIQFAHTVRLTEE